jgi:hypothetical protein
MDWIVIPVFWRTRRTKVKSPRLRVTRCTISGILGRLTHEDHVEEVGDASITLTSEGELFLDSRHSRRRSAALQEVSGISRGDSSNGPDPAGRWVKIDFSSGDPWILIWIQPPDHADVFCGAFSTWAAEIGVSTTYVAGNG